MNYYQNCKVDLAQLESDYPEAYRRLDEALAASQERFLWEICKMSNAYTSSMYELVRKHFWDKYGMEIEADEGPNGYGWIIQDHDCSLTYHYTAPVTAQAAMLKAALRLAQRKIKAGR